VAFHHLALVTRDARATHVFYSEAMGFELVKTVVGATPAGGWAKHFFYDTGRGELMAFWELHDDSVPDAYPTALSTGVGLPEWVNHVAFGAEDRADLERRRERLRVNGYDVLEIDHGWCHSIYTRDPNGTLVEFCTTTRDFDAEDRRRAVEALRSPHPPLEAPGPKPKLHEGIGTPLHLRAGDGS
jgi:catechol 2,3-dioxygenase-like lactoylglutathione lyase family enzyme